MEMQKKEKEEQAKMYEKIPTAGLSRQEWLQLRKQGIGGSDAGAICGLNPYSSPMNVFLDKTSDETEELDNEAVRIGNDLEQYVAERFMEATGLKVRRSNFLYRSKKHPFMIADIDRLVIGEDAGLECKTASLYQADKWAEGKVPLHYVIQCCHYMAVSGKRTWYIACVILGKEFLYRKLTWDDILMETLIQTEQEFWERYVIPGTLPPPDGTESCDKVLGRYFGKAKKAGAIKLVGFDEKLERREEILSRIEKLQTEQRQIEQEIKLYMRENELAFNDRYRVSWSNVDSTRLDTKRMKQEKPEIYADYAKTTSSRRFTIKAS